MTMQLYTATTLLIPRELSITILSFVVFFFCKGVPNELPFMCGLHQKLFEEGIWHSDS